MDSVYFDDPDGVHLELNARLPAWAAWPNDHAPWSREPCDRHVPNSTDDLAGPLAKSCQDASVSNYRH
jgi:hypothetical protein